MQKQTAEKKLEKGIKVNEGPICEGIWQGCGYCGCVASQKC